MKKIAIYMRVSTTSQSFASQEPDLNRWIKTNGASNVKWYRDKFTGRTMKRPGFDKLLAEIQAGKIKTIVTWRMDRLGRTASGLTWLFNYLLENNVNLVSIKDGFDLNTSQGRLLANLLASISQFETEIRGERVKAGQEVARSNGKRWGGSKKGHRKSKTAKKANAVLKLYKQGMSKLEISRSVNLSAPTIYSIIREG